jgi:predicted DCC family thiol-disulfide oxidoreductase YuxK
MNTLKDHLILFDAECPMCSMYTKAFVSTGLIEKTGRAAYQETALETCPLVDRQRAANEIALVNQATGEVTYGIVSLFKVFAVALPMLKPLFEYKPFIWLMSKLYAFISYNRRVIIPAKNEHYQYQPTFKLHYRLAYLLITWVVTSYILTSYVHLMQGLLPIGTGYREYLICGGQIIFQGILITIVAKNKKWDYLGNMMTISFAGALLLLPGLILSTQFNLSPVFYALYFMAVAGLMLMEHFRRSKLLLGGSALTISWVCYRFLVLIVIFLAH